MSMHFWSFGRQALVIAAVLATAEAAAQQGTGTATEPATEPATETEAATEPATETAPEAEAAPAKVAIVVAGDPDAPLRDAALQLEQEITAVGLRIPADPALRAALRGEPAPPEDDGLGRLRASRRTLGLDPANDAKAYRRMGAVSGADALAVLQTRRGVVVEIYDVTAGRFYESVLTWKDKTPQQRARFVQRRADASRARRVTSLSTPATGTPTDTSEQLNTDTTKDDRGARKWMKKNWPYFVVGALLAGGITYLVIDRTRDNGSGPPVLRFRPGEQP